MDSLGSWDMNEYRRIGSFAKPITRKNLDKSSSTDVYSVTKYNGFVRSLDYFKKQVFSRDLSTYKIVKKGEFAYSTIHLDEGAIGLLRDDEALISPMYTVFEVDKSVDIFYIDHLISSDFLLNKYALIGQGSINRRKSIPFSSFADLELRIPSLGEQKKIAEILTGIDTLIKKINVEIKKIQILKKGIIKKFLKEGTNQINIQNVDSKNIPLNWKIFKLGEICKFTQGVQIPLNQTTRKEQTGFIRYLYINDFSSDDKKLFIRNDFPSKIVKKKDLVMANTGHTAGTIFRGKEGVLSNNAFKISFPNVINSDYLYYYLSTEEYWLDVRRIFNTAGQPHVGHGNIANIKFLCPPLEEQEKIVSIINSIELNLTKKYHKVSKLISTKKSLIKELISDGKRVII